MFIDLDQYDGPNRIMAGICVIGGGAAGITIARRLLSLGHQVTLLESGGIDYEAATADLNAGSCIGDQYYDLEDARLRFFGGTTAIWGGRIAELDPVDLQERPWVPHSGWPVSWDELAAYYPQARREFGIPEHSATVQELRRNGMVLPEFDPQLLEIGTWDFDRRFNRFQFQSCHDLTTHPRCTIFTHATATQLQLAEGGAAVAAIHVKSISGRTLDIAADYIVLAAGGIENPRLLLASRSVAPNGVGNDHDQVGRYFMEHPHARGGKVVGRSAWLLLNAFSRPRHTGTREVAALIKPSVQQQAQRAILNTSLTITARQPATASQALGMRLYSSLKHGIAPTRRGRALWMATKTAATWLQRHTDPLRPWLLHQLGMREIALLVRAEQAPNPASRIVLTNRTDPLGMARVALDWRMTQLDINSVSGLVELLDGELRRLGLGRAVAADWLGDGGTTWRTDPLISAHPIGGYHHMGTTRMSSSPRHGVTDGTGQVHGVQNLFVAGSSVFPTSGWANPTLTIVALALRTADQIAARVARALAA